MTLETVTLRLPRALLADAQRLAHERGITVGAMIRHYLEHETTKPPETLPERTVRLTTSILERARNWDDLSDQLHQAGYTLKPHGTGLALYDARTGKYICNTSKAGFKYRKLVKRFRAVMPGHPQGARHLPKPQQHTPAFDVIE